MVYDINLSLGEMPAEPRYTRSIAKSPVSFAQALAAVPLFTTWNNIPVPSSASPLISNLNITTQAATNRRNDGRRRSSS